MHLKNLVVAFFGSVAPLAQALDVQAIRPENWIGGNALYASTAAAVQQLVQNFL